jgi:ribosome-associated protein
LVRVCARLAEDKKADQIVILDLRGLMYVTDFFLIASGANARQLQAIRIAILEEMAQRGARPIGVEGAGQDRWVLMDYGDFVVHLFDPEWRKLYDLELLWGDAPRIEWQAPRRPRTRSPVPRRRGRRSGTEDAGQGGPEPRRTGRRGAAPRSPT